MRIAKTAVAVEIAVVVAVPSEEANGQLAFTLVPQQQTLWYGVTR